MPATYLALSENRHSARGPPGYRKAIHQSTNSFSPPDSLIV
jgi:hypothetical protein